MLRMRIKSRALGPLYIPQTHPLLSFFFTIVLFNPPRMLLFSSSPHLLILTGYTFVFASERQSDLAWALGSTYFDFFFWREWSGLGPGLYMAYYGLRTLL